LAETVRKYRTWSARSQELTLRAIERSARRTHSHSKRPAWRKLVPALVIMLGLFLAWRYTPLSDVITASNVIKWARTVGSTPWAPFAIVAAYCVAAFTMFPRPLITLLCVIAYGPWLGASLAMGGIMASALSVYFAGRALPDTTLHELGGEKLEKTGRMLRKHGVAAALAVSIVPVAPFPMVGMTAGAAKVRLWHFLTGVSLGMLPGTIATAVFTNQVLAALDEDGEVNLWLVAGVVIVLIALILIVRRWFAKMQSD
jgi:phospholipase D1/2